MIVRDIDFGSVLDASGVRGFFGDGYWFHKIFGVDFSGSTFVSKTTTLEPRRGNMPVDENGDPLELYPHCIVAKPLKGVALNAVGLSGPGAEALLKTGRWQKRQEPFFISFMAVGKTKRERKAEVFEFLRMLNRYRKGFQAPVGLQINYSCPNAGSYCNKDEMYDSDFLNEVFVSMADAHGVFGFSAMAKFNILTSVEFVKELCSYSFCDAVCVSNTIPWGALPDAIDWKGIFGTDESPLAKFGGGGLSGKPLLPFVADWVRRAREAGITKPINAGGGILSPKDVKLLFDAGADSVFIGSAAILRPWRVENIITFAQEYATRKGGENGEKGVGYQKA